MTKASRADLDVALATLEAGVRDVEPVDAATLVTRLGAIVTLAGARLATLNSTPTVAPAVPDELLDVKAAAHLVRRSLSWMRHNGHTLPGYRQPSGKGTRVQWSRTALEKWFRTGGTC